MRKCLFGALMLLTPWAANAAGLGQLTVQSALGQPLRAEIDLVSVQKAQLGSLAVRLAPPDAYRQAGLRYSRDTAELALRIVNRADGQPYIRVTSTRPVTESVVDVLVDLSWPSGRITREYRVLLDPPAP